MNLISIFNIRGTDYRILAMGVAANLLWSFFVLVIGFLYLLEASEGDGEMAYVGLMIAEFIGPFLIGWFCGWLAFDDRGATYGVIGAVGSVLLILLTLLASGWIAIMLAITALAGGFNGGAISRYRGKR
jgi:mannitol-specific phosphotransferase system IIBC component